MFESPKAEGVVPEEKNQTNEGLLHRFNSLPKKLLAIPALVAFLAACEGSSKSTIEENIERGNIEYISAGLVIRLKTSTAVLIDHEDLDKLPDILENNNVTLYADGDEQQGNKTYNVSFGDEDGSRRLYVFWDNPGSEKLTYIEHEQSDSSNYRSAFLDGSLKNTNDYVLVRASVQIDGQEIEYDMHRELQGVNEVSVSDLIQISEIETHLVNDSERIDQILTEALDKKE